MQNEKAFHAPNGNTVEWLMQAGAQNAGDRLTICGGKSAAEAGPQGNYAVMGELHYPCSVSVKMCTTPTTQSQSETAHIRKNI